MAAITTILAATAVAATGYSVVQGQKAAKAQRAAANTQIQMQQQQAARERRSAIRANLVRRAQLRAQAQAMGVETSSGALGGQTSLSSQLGANLGFGSMMSGLSQQYTGLTAQAADYSARSQMGSAIAGFAFQGAQSLAGTSFGQKRVTNLFG
jgi:hypothetical protein